MKQINNETPEMIFVEGGTFQMGSTEWDKSQPIHSVTLSDFLMAKYQVTQGLWESVMGNNPSKFTGDDNLPVENVSWYDAVEFCNKLSEKEGFQKVYSGSGRDITMNMNANGYRLPTEAEWEYAARGGSLSKAYKYSGSNNARDVAWYEDNSGNMTQPVGQKQPNELGIYDMSGNVWEWCWDRYDDYSSESQTNPMGPASGYIHMLRGGSWRDHDGHLRPADRGNYIPVDGCLGFRVVMSKYPTNQRIIHIKPEDLPKMVKVDGGTFQMGNNNGDIDEKPVHSVTLSDFMIGKYAVTQGLWKSVMGSNPSHFTGDDNLPVENVSWYDAVEFCNILSEKEGLQEVYSGSGDNITMDMNANGYRLPTEAEWEYAAKGGSLSKDYKYSGSNNADDVAWYRENSGRKTHPVGQKQPNELGLYDMSGSVWEWCGDWYDDYNSEAQTNRTGPSTGRFRVLRGGSWACDAGDLRQAYRFNYHPDIRFYDLGFRVVRSKYPANQPINHIKPEDLPKMVNVEGGTFQMGSSNGEPEEKPVHSVTLSDFLIAKYAVTQGLWKSVMGNNPSRFTRDNNLPVEKVSWYDAVEFCNKLSEKKGLQRVYSGSGDNITMNMNANGYRLPTEAEWEYAAKGGKLSKGCTYSGSNNAEDVAWYRDNSDKKTHPVGQKQPNELGIYDMSGNVNEWCWDWYGGYRSVSQTNPTGPYSGSYRVARGGSWYNGVFGLQPANRSCHNPNYREIYCGFRLVMCKYPASQRINHIKPEDQINMVNVGGGTFQMGSDNGYDTEKPVHSVTLSDFMIGKYEVTQGLWKSVFWNNPSYFRGDDNLPVEQISWYDAVEFCNILSEKEGLQKVYSINQVQIDPHNHCEEDKEKWMVSCDFAANGYRLPTEAEWEYAARGGSLSKGCTYSGSDNADEVAWYDNSSGRKTHPVGRKQPNELGIHDMSGNVNEWCWDWYGDYSSGSQTNPIGFSSGSYRVGRGGCWGSGAGSLRSAYRNNNVPDSRDDYWGFRLARSK